MPVPAAWPPSLARVVLMSTTPVLTVLSPSLGAGVVPLGVSLPDDGFDGVDGTTVDGLDRSDVEGGFVDGCVVVGWPGIVSSAALCALLSPCRVALTISAPPAAPAKNMATATTAATATVCRGRPAGAAVENGAAGPGGGPAAWYPAPLG